MLESWRDTCTLGSYLNDPDAWLIHVYGRVERKSYLYTSNRVEEAAPYHILHRTHARYIVLCIHLKLDEAVKSENNMNAKT
jgi:hypothetical protein